MKNFYHSIRFGSMALLLLLSAVLSAQTRTATTSGNWNSTTTWGGNSVPTSANNVTINSGVTVTVTDDATCNSLSFLSTNSANSNVNLNAGVTLNVAHAVTIPRGNNGSNTLAVGAGNLIAESIAFTNGGGTQRHFLTISTGTASVGDITESGSTGSATITFTGSGLLQVRGTFLNSDNGTFTRSTGTVEFKNSGPQTIGDFTFNNVILSNSGAKTVTGATINGTLSLQGTATAIGTSPTYGSAAVLEYKGSAAQTTSNVEFPSTLNADLSINNGLDVTLNGGKTVNGNISLVFGALIAGNNLTMSASGTPIITRTGGTLTGNLQGGNDYNVVYNGLGKITGQELSGSGLNSVTVAMDAGQGVSLNQNRAPDGNLTISSGTLFLEGLTINRSSNGGTLTVSAGAELQIGGTNTIPSNYNTHSISSTSTVAFTGTNQTIPNLNSAQSYGNVTLDGTGTKTLTNETINGVLSIQGNVSIGGVAPTYGTNAILEYKGTATQTISNIEFPGTGTNPANLRIDNTHGVTLSANKTINGALTLVNGYLTTTGLLTIGNAGSATTTNGAFVNGPLAKAKNTTALFTFPVGTLTGGLRTIGVTPQTTTAATYKATFFSANPRTVTNGSNLGTLQQLSACEYWDLAETAGTTPARVTVSWPAAANSCGSGNYVSNLLSLVVAHHNGTNWVDEGQTSNTGNASNGGTVTSNLFLSSFSPFALATSSANLNPLPVTLNGVKAFEKNHGVEIDWSNLTETNVSNYVIERSVDGVHFTQLDLQQPKHNLNDRVDYTSFDASPVQGINYYRVVVTEADGKKTYSAIVRVSVGTAQQQGLLLYPNPVKNKQLSVALTGVNAGMYKLSVVNAGGQTVYTETLSHPGGSFTKTLQLPQGIQSGVYSLVISGDSYQGNKMFIVQ